MVPATTNHHQCITSIKSSKAAEIYREDGGRIYYLCFHCGFDSDNISDTLAHIDVHFSLESSELSVSSDEHFNLKCEPNDEVDQVVEVVQMDEVDEVDPNQLEQIFIDCGTKAYSNNNKSFQIDTFAVTIKSEQQTPLQPEHEPINLDGLFEWKCLHCHCLFKKCTKLKQHLMKHNTDPVRFDATIPEDTKIKVHYTLKCTLCSFDFYDTHSAEKHLQDLHPASPPVKCFQCCEQFPSAELLQKHMSTVHKSIEKEAPVKNTTPIIKTIKRKKVPAKATTKGHSSCALCDKTFTKKLEFMQHTFSHFDLKMFNCPECPSNFQRKSSFNGHMRNIHPLLKLEPKYFCRFCNDNVDHSNLVDFVTHAFQFHLDDGDRQNSNLDSLFDYQCRFCFQTFGQWNDAHAHSKTHIHDELPTTHLPTADGRTFTERAKSGSYRSEFLYNCHFCTSTLSGSYEARTHWVTEHQPLQSTPVRYRIVSPKRRFQCHDCDSSFDTEIYLMRHRLSHFNVEIYSCTHCTRTFSTGGHQTRHLTKEHAVMPLQCRNLICKFCNIKCTEDNEFIAHNYKEHLYEHFNINQNLDGRCKYVCMYCNEITVELDCMQQHLEGHVDAEIPSKNKVDITSKESSINELRHQIKFMYRCLQCPLTFRLPVVAKEHVTLVHRVESFDNKTPVEDKTTIDNEASVENKETSVESEKTIKAKTLVEAKKDTCCSVCEITFRTWRSLINHRAKIHPELITKHRKYNKKAAQPVKRKRTSPTGNLCNICNLTFVNNRSMVNHRAKRHPETVQAPSAQPTNACTICGKIFRDVSNFKAHLKRHDGVHSYTCDICNKTYGLKVSLQTHMVTHTNEKNFICEECGKCFYTTSKLNLHKQVHENLTLQCKECDKVFYTRNNFSKHMKTHMHSERKKCKLCENTFKSAVSLRVHMMLHEEKKKFSCRYCDMTFAQSSGRRGHERAKHGLV